MKIILILLMLIVTIAYALKAYWECVEIDAQNKVDLYHISIGYLDGLGENYEL